MPAQHFNEMWLIPDRWHKPIAHCIGWYAPYTCVGSCFDLRNWNKIYQMLVTLCFPHKHAHTYGKIIVVAGAAVGTAGMTAGNPAGMTAGTVAACCCSLAPGEAVEDIMALDTGFGGD